MEHDFFSVWERKQSYYKYVFDYTYFSKLTTSGLLNKYSPFIQGSLFISVVEKILEGGHK